MKNFNFRTDMADERVDTYKQVNNLTEINGIKVESKTEDIIKTTTVDVLNENGKNAVKKDIGKYITMEIKDVEYLTDEQKQSVIAALANQIKILIGKEVNSFMIVGLGNEAVTPDALGPKVVSFVNVTRHMLMYAKEYVEPGTKEISAISPGVLGTTGIETEEIIEAVTKIVNPEVLIVIDSLASMSMDRLGKTIQLGNTGITPGAGVGNKRRALNKESLGMDVIAIGVPLVVDMATITNEAIDKLTDNLKNEATNYMNHGLDKNKVEEIFSLFDRDDRYTMIANALHTDNYIVTPKEIDNVLLKISEIIASGLNVAL
ncbi:MAG: GPR endopeptidase [Clostridia bacterium]|nr:GPR endopeptidase [Clostridia bacterium]